MKRISLTFIVVFTIALTMISCSAKKKTVGLFLYSETDPFINETTNSIINSFNGKYNITTYYAASKQSVQNYQLQDALDDGVDLVIMNTVDRLAAFSLIEKCNQYQVPILFFNREPIKDDLNTGINTYYVGIRAEENGELQAEAARDLFGDPLNINEKYDKNGDNKIQIFVLKGERAHQDAEKRTKASIDRLKELGYSIEIVGIEICNWKRSESFSIMKKLGEEFYDSIELILSNNDEMAIGAIEYYQYLQKQPDYIKKEIVPIIGVDATTSGRQAIADGYMYATIINDGYSQAKAIQELTKIVFGYMGKEDLSFPLYDDKYIYIKGEIYKKN